MYTVDLDILCIQEKKKKTRRKLTYDQKKKISVLKRLRVAAYHKKVFKGLEEPSTIIHQDPNLVAMRKPFSKEFFEEFQKAMVHYIAGEWT